MRLVLRRGTRAAFEAVGDDAIFDVADAVLLTDPPALLACSAGEAGRTETPLEHDPDTDVSGMVEFEVRRVQEDLVVRIDDRAWRAERADPIRFVFPRMLGPRPVSIGHGSI